MFYTYTDEMIALRQLCHPDWKAWLRTLKYIRSLPEVTS